MNAIQTQENEPAKSLELFVKLRNTFTILAVTAITLTALCIVLYMAMLLLLFNFGLDQSPGYKTASNSPLTGTLVNGLMVAGFLLAAILYSSLWFFMSRLASVAKTLFPFQNTSLLLITNIILAVVASALWGVVILMAIGGIMSLADPESQPGSNILLQLLFLPFGFISFFGVPLLAILLGFCVVKLRKLETTALPH